MSNPQSTDRDEATHSGVLMKETKPIDSSKNLKRSPSISDDKASLRNDLSIRGRIGETMHGFTNTINNNLITVRSGVTAGIVLLTAYGLSNTPLFFRFRTVSEIPGR